MDSYDVHVHPIQFQLYHLYDKESFGTFNIMQLWHFTACDIMFHGTLKSHNDFAGSEVP